MLHMLRDGSAVCAEPCKLGRYVSRYPIIMKTMERSVIAPRSALVMPLVLSLAMALLGARAFSQALPTPSQGNGEPALKVAEPQKLPAQKDLRAKRGTDLRLALMPQKVDGNVAPVVGAKVITKSTKSAQSTEPLDKPQGGLATVSDISGGDTPPEHHLSALERQEMRVLLRQQRQKQQN